MIMIGFLYSLSKVQRDDIICPIVQVPGLGDEYLMSKCLQVSMVAAGDGVVDRMRDATKPNTKMYLGETIANPTLEILDLKAFGQLGQENSIMTAVDATFSTPINQVCHIPAQRTRTIHIVQRTTYIG